MTFLSNVLTKDDPNNTFTATTSSKSGIGTDTTGYNNLIINAVTTEDSIAGGLQIQFSATGTDFEDENTIFYRDTVFKSSSGSGVTFIKTYPILKQYYRIRYLSSSPVSYTITSRLSTQQYTNNQNSISAFDNNMENSIDAFGKLRVSYPHTLLDLRVPGQDANGVGTTGATGYITNEIQICNSFTVGITGSTGSTGYKICNNSQMDIYVKNSGTYTNQSRKYCTYQPGKSLLIMMSGIMDASKALINGSSGNPNGTKSTLGYYDDYNGIYYQYISSGGGSGSCSVNIKSNNKSPTSVSQSDWNIDKMDGKGISRLKLDWTKAQLFVIDLEWLGVGRVRFGFYAYGKIQYCHEITNINSISMGPYTYNINLPIRYQLEVINDGTGAMIQICSTVISEGGYSPVGRPFSKSVLKTPTTGVENYLLYLRGGNDLGNYYHQQILPTDLTFASGQLNDVGILTVTMYLPPITTDLPITWTNVNSNYSVCQYGTTGTVSSPGIILYESAISGRGSVNFSDLSNTFNDIMQITSDISNNSSIIAISIKGNFTGGSNVVYCTLSWVEIY